MNAPSPLQLLRQHFGYDQFRPGQAAIIERVLAGGHAMVVMPTGRGKSLCYQLPALAQPDDGHSLVLVLSPLIALMQDQVDALRRRQVPATFINSSLTREARAERLQAIARGEFRLLFVTPERFRQAEFREVIEQRRVSLLAVDEAHCVSQWGHDFRPDYTRVGEIRRFLGDPPTLALTATATEACRRDIYRQLQLGPEEVALFHEGIERPNLDLEVIPVFAEDEKLTRLNELLEDAQRESGPAIVYFSLIKTLKRFSDHLLAEHIDHVCYHGDLPRQARRRVQDQFMSGETDLVLATNAFGMGIDRADIRLIVHAETPGSIESYYQEIGRAGRDGLPSRCVWLYDQADLMTQMQFIEWANPDAAFYTRLHRLLVERQEQCRAYGLEWVNDQLQRRSKHDHRLATAIAILDRYGVIAGPRPPQCFHVRGELPAELQDDSHLAEKKRRDQQRLYALVELANETGDRQAFLNRYFGPAG